MLHPTSLCSTDSTPRKHSHWTQISTKTPHLPSPPAPCPIPHPHHKTPPLRLHIHTLPLTGSSSVTLTGPCTRWCSVTYRVPSFPTNSVSLSTHPQITTTPPRPHSILPPLHPAPTCTHTDSHWPGHHRASVTLSGPWTGWWRHSIPPPTGYWASPPRVYSTPPHGRTYPPASGA